MVKCKHTKKENDLLALLEIIMLEERGAKHGEDTVFVLMCKTAMDKDSYQRVIHGYGKKLDFFP